MTGSAAPAGWREVFRHANAMLRFYPDGKRAAEYAATIPKEHRDNAKTLARRQWRTWQTSNFIFPWCEVRKTDGQETTA